MLRLKIKSFKIDDFSVIYKLIYPKVVLYYSEITSNFLEKEGLKDQLIEFFKRSSYSADHECFIFTRPNVENFFVLREWLSIPISKKTIITTSLNFKIFRLELYEYFEYNYLYTTFENSFEIGTLEDLLSKVKCVVLGQEFEIKSTYQIKKQTKTSIKNVFRNQHHDEPKNYPFLGTRPESPFADDQTQMEIVQDTLVLKFIDSGFSLGHFLLQISCTRGSNSHRIQLALDFSHLRSRIAASSPLFFGALSAKGSDPLNELTNDFGSDCKIGLEKEMAKNELILNMLGKRERLDAPAEKKTEDPF